VDQGFASKRPCRGVSSAEETSNYGTPDSANKSEIFSSVSPLQNLFKSELFNQKVEKDMGRQDNQDTIMADQTTNSVILPFGTDVSTISGQNSELYLYLMIHC
jgi:hypothetical protein